MRGKADYSFLAAPGDPRAVAAFHKAKADVYEEHLTTCANLVGPDVASVPDAVRALVDAAKVLQRYARQNQRLHMDSLSREVVEACREIEALP